jgi:hypothetical protein
VRKDSTEKAKAVFSSSKAEWVERRLISYFTTFKDSVDKLTIIAQKELDDQPFSADETAVLHVLVTKSGLRFWTPYSSPLLPGPRVLQINRKNTSIV